MRRYTLLQLADRVKRQGKAALEPFCAWLVREPSPWQPPSRDTHSTMPILPNLSLRAGGESLAMELSLSPKRPQVTLGRAESSDIVIHDATLSSLHLVFVEEADGWKVRDASSSNGTVLNGKKLQPSVLYPLRNGDAMSAGQVQLTFHDVEGLLGRIALVSQS
jgi:hypothetical protein